MGVLGATSLVGERVLRLLASNDLPITAYSRTVVDKISGGVTWRRIESKTLLRAQTNQIQNWLCVAPIWVLPDYFDLLEACGARRVVALSSTSRFTKGDSTDLDEQEIAVRLTDAETRLQAWAEGCGVEWVVLRPTLIYGFGRDKNIAEIACFIRRFRFFPLLGHASGLRQPVHADDVAKACLVALDGRQVLNRSYNLAGGETLSYREMVKRIFTALGYSPRLITIPYFIFRAAVACLRILPRYRNWSPAMAQRMNSDLVFGCSDAARDIGFAPRGFNLTKDDLPSP